MEGKAPAMRGPCCRCGAWLRVVLVLMVLTGTAYGRIGLVVGEPFGVFGTILPVGHASIYLDRLCAASPTELRPCRAGELGVVISRYHDLTTMHLDWMAVPAAVFFYGVDDPADAPTWMTASLEAEIRERYREEHLMEVVPDRMDRNGAMHRAANGDWAEAIGAAFDRRLLVYNVETSAAQDEAILEYVNGLSNERRYTLARANCADFAADLLALALPAHPKRNFFADFDMTTPKNLAKQMDALPETHPELNLRVYEVPQVAGTLRRSRPVRGSAETFVKTKRYLFTLVVIQPEALVADWVLYEAKGRWKPGSDATPLEPEELNVLTMQPSSGTVTDGTAADDARGRSEPHSEASTSSNMASAAIGLRAK